MAVKRARFQIIARDPVSGRVVDNFMHADHLLTSGVVEFLTKATELAPEAMACYAVVDEYGRAQGAEHWMEEHAVDHVVAAWTAGAPAAQTARQQKLSEWWPALGLALSNLEANYEEAPSGARDGLYDPKKEYYRAKSGTRMHRYRWDRGDVKVSWCGRELAELLAPGRIYGPVCKVCVINERAWRDAEA